MTKHITTTHLDGRKLVFNRRDLAKGASRLSRRMSPGWVTAIMRNGAIYAQTPKTPWGERCKFLMQGRPSRPLLVVKKATSARQIEALLRLKLNR